MFYYPNKNFHQKNVFSKKISIKKSFSKKLSKYITKKSVQYTVQDLTFTMSQEKQRKLFFMLILKSILYTPKSSKYYDKLLGFTVFDYT